MPKNPHADFTPTLAGYSGITPFRFWCQTALPLTYDDSLSYYELLNKVVKYLNHTIEDLTNVENNTSELAEAYDKLQKYVNDYFDDIDIEAELRNVLDGMAEDGTLDALLDPLVAERLPGVVENQISNVVAEQIGGAVAGQIGDTVAEQLPASVEDQLPGVVDKKIDGVVAEQIDGAVAGQIDESVADQLPPVVAEAIPSKVTDWLNENVEPVGSAIMVDSSLTISGAAADAKVTGDELSDLKTQLSETTYNLVIGRIPHRIISSSGTFQNNPDNDMWVAPVEQDKYYTAKTTDSSGLVCGFFTSNPLTTTGATSYNNSRTIQANNYTIQAPITGYIAFRCITTVNEVQIVEGQMGKPYIPPITAVDIIARREIQQIEDELTPLIDSIPNPLAVSTNVFNPENCLDGKIIANNASGGTFTYADGILSGYFPVEEGKTYIITNTPGIYCGAIAFYDSDKLPVCAGKIGATSSADIGLSNLPDIDDEVILSGTLSKCVVTIAEGSGIAFMLWYVTNKTAISSNANYYGSHTGLTGIIDNLQVICCDDVLPYTKYLTGFNNLTKAISDIIASAISSPMNGKQLTCCGDSITEGALLDDLSAGDPYIPRSGKKKPTFGYFIAKCNNMTWDNKGISGSTLTNITPGGVSKNAFVKPSTGRLYNLPADSDYILLQFGNNDQYYGPISEREKWLYETYGQTIYWPTSQSQIGTTGYATQEQVDACNAVHGDYATSDEYFQHKFLGSSTSTDITLYNGAWNAALQYIIGHFPYSKILIMSAYNEPDWIADADKSMAIKWGLPYLNLFDDGQMMIYKQDTPTVGMVDGVSVAQFRINHLTVDGTHQNLEGMKYMWQRINAKLLSL